MDSAGVFGIPMSVTVRETKFYCADGGIARAPARSRAARFLHAQREALVSQFGGHPSPSDAIRIERLSRLLLRFEQLDKEDRAATPEQLDAELNLNERLFDLLAQIGADRVAA
jgi:hypothetical protein